MKKRFLTLIFTITAMLLCIFGLSACGKVEFKVNFVVDGEVYATLNTNGEEIIKMPENPTKEDYTFDGWYWDKDTWQTPFTANSLLDAPLSSDMSVYAKFTKKHEHNYTATVTEPTCTEKGYTTYTCDCGDNYKDNYVNELGHEFLNYVSDNNATYDRDGTKTAYCTHGCGTTDIIPDTGTKLQSEIVFKTLSVDNELTVYGKVPNKQATFSFINEVEIKGNATFVVSTDIYGIQQIPTKTVPLEIGDNTFYITETVGNNIRLFTVTVRRRPVYTVSFDSNGGTAVVSQTIEEDSLATEPTTTRTGYTFNTWDYDFATPITKKTKITASWSANKDTKYTVNYYLQNLDDDGYALHETVELKGETDTPTAEVDIKEYTHFTYNASKSVVSGNINGDGGQVLSVYYTRDSYKIVANNNNTKAGTVTAGDTYKFDKQITLTATTNAGYTWLGWYDGETLACETEEFTFKAEKDVTYTATWSANTDTKYTVNYYLQNLADDGYALHETVELKGETDTPTAEVDIREYAHFTYNESASRISGNIDGDGNGILSVYYTRDSYDIVVNHNAKAGTATSVNGIYRYEKEFALTATTNAGYTWLGWYDGETLACATEEFTFKAEKDVTYTATWSANADTKYTINYYLQTLGDTYYTLQETVELEDETDTTATAEIKEYTHFTYNANKSVISGNINGDGSCILSVYYTRNTYTLSVNNSSAGSITKIGTYKYGAKEFMSTVTPYLGYYFLGWYNGETLLSTDLTYTFTATQNVQANFEVKEEMSNFEFTSTVNTCKITGVKDKTVTKIFIPDSVTSIDFTFAFCSGLTSIEVSENNTVYKSINGNLYNKNGTTLIQYAIGKTATSFTIFESVTSIGNQAFANCDNLTSVKIPNSVTSIGIAAFYNCCDLTNVVIGEGVTSIGYYAFDGCSSLTSVEIPDSVISIGGFAFRGCINLTSVKIPNSVTSIGSSAFSGCSSLTEITLPFVGANRSATSASSSTLFGYIFGTSVYTNGRELAQYYSYNTYAKYYIPISLKKVTVTSGEILYGAFYNCSSLTNVVIDEGVTSIGDSAFKYCSSLTSIEIPNSVTSIGGAAFMGCINLTSVKIPNSVTSISSAAFYNCYDLTNLVIPDSVTSIGFNAFNGCSSLTSVTIPNSVTSIDNDAFSGCSSLTSVTIGNSVTSIGYYAFYNCSSLTRVYYTGTAEQWSEITIGSYNTKLSNATRYYYNATSPTNEGKYWHYDENGNIVFW